MPGFPLRRKQRHDRHDFEREQVVFNFHPVDSCTCRVLPPSDLIVETDTERAFRAARAELCDPCLARLLG